MKGIYKFTNLVNGKIYIGQSIHLSIRYNQHKNRYDDENDSEYSHSFHSAIRKYGWNNFQYEVLVDNDDLSLEDLDNLEIYYIAYYNSYYDGYNEDKGGSNAIHPRKLNDELALQLKNEIKNTDISFTNLSAKYNISIGMVSDINKGNHWSHIGEFTYPIRDISIKQNLGERHPRAHFTDNEVLEIRKKYMTTQLDELYNEYKNYISYAAFKKIIYGNTFQHVPYYKKREKKWYQFGTCIDYSPEGK